MPGTLDDALYAAIAETLKSLTDPATGKNIVEEGLVTNIALSEGNARLVLDIGARDAAAYRTLAEEAERKVRALAGIKSCAAVLTAETSPSSKIGTAARTSTAAEKNHSVQGGHRPIPGTAASDPSASGIRNVKAIIAVASGKGGVGKSTTAVNLALALSGLGLRTGLLDADIYGPSIPLMLGIPPETRPELDGKTLRPLDAHGLKTLSIGNLIDADRAVVWRGPMVMGALQQLVFDVNWGGLDVLLCDMPPGTGDAHLTLAQRVPLKGVIVVSTPQDVALIDARKGIDMFRRVNVPILGLIENMSVFVCPHCGGESHIFAHGGAERTAGTLGVPFLGAIPLSLAIREQSDSGNPAVLAKPDSADARAYIDIARAISRAFGEKAGA